jgi:hypothetical protein
MIKEIIEKWEKNKQVLEAYFRSTKQEEYSDYENIVRKIIELVLNTDEDSYENFDLEKLTVLDHGSYQGTQIFIVPKKTYQPGVEEYLLTHTYYGSCSGCDTLQGICGYEYELPTDNQVSEYMTLSLHLVQKMKWLDSAD